MPWQLAGKAFYTTPLKALSNQKYGELVASYGEEHVGLLTGDTTVRPRAPVVVMTTEVLRNMLLAGSDLLEGLHTVVLDEVHFIQDPYRGGVWEEVLVLSPPEVRFVCLSATVNNAGELGGWLRSVRGDTAVIVERQRPIVLRHHFAVHRREDDETLCSRCCSTTGSPAVRGCASTRRCAGRCRVAAAALAAARARAAPALTARRCGPRWSRSSRQLEMLPAIVFIFSRAACDDAVRQVVRDGVRLTDARRAHRHPRGRRAPGRAARATTTSASSATTSGSKGWSAGVAAHHAGLVPVFRETVEECFAAGLLEGGLRHRDAVARHQHAGPLGGRSSGSPSTAAPGGPR